MKRPTSLAILWLFAQTAVRRLINRSASLKISRLRRKAADPSDAPPRQATLARGERRSLVRRLVGLWLPITSIMGILMLSFNSLFIMLESVLLDDSGAAPVLRLSKEDFAGLNRAAAIGDQKPRSIAVELVLARAYDGPAPWLAAAERTLALQRFDQRGMPAFAPLPDNARWSGTLAYLSPAGRAKGLRIVAAYLALLQLATFFVAFGVMGKNLSHADPTLGWLWQFPVSRRALFFAKLVEYMFDNPAAPLGAIFYATVLWLCGASFAEGLGLALLFGLAAAASAAAARVALEVFMNQRLSRRTRGMIVAGFATAGSVLMLTMMVGGNSQLVVESFTRLASALPAWTCWNPLSAGIGSEAMLNSRTAWWLAAPAFAAALALAAVSLSAWLTRGGLASAQESVRSTAHPATRRSCSAAWSGARLGAVAEKEWLQLRRRPEMLGQVLAAPLMVGVLLYVSGYRSLVQLATAGGTNMSVAILVAAAYMLVVAAGQTIGCELKSLWLLQCQPRPLADVVRGKARVWAAIAIGMSLPLVGAAIAAQPAESALLAVRLPFLIAALWLLAELAFGFTALSARIDGEGKIRFRRDTALIPALLVSNAAMAIYSQSWWLQLSVFATYAMLNAAVRERQLAMLPWLSEPAEQPPKQFSAMHGMLAIVGFQAVMGVICGVAASRPGWNAIATMSVYSIPATAAGAVCWFVLRRKDSARTESPHGLLCATNV